MSSANRRVLIIDDDAAIHSALTSVLRKYEVVSAYDGPTALRHLEGVAALPFAVAFIDVEMPGWDGLETLTRLWSIDPDLQAVLCTGTDLRYEQIRARLPETDAIVVIKKPFSAVEVLQATQALTRKWTLQREARRHVEELEAAVVARTIALETANKKLADELAWRDRAEAELRLSQRLEAVGQLAAGIAHEINNPIQYMGDNLAFLTEVVDELLSSAQALRDAIAADPVHAALAPLLDNIDFTYIEEELPRSATSIRAGLERITGIVRAMKQLSRPGVRAAAPADINAALEDALCVSASTYRSVARLDKRLTALPAVICHIAELGQVFLNLIVNAAQAMEGSVGGTLGVSSSLEGDHIVIAISDTGTGIPDEIRDRIFDPFFSTKEVGRGTGQGLAIARSIIVDRHRGTLGFHSAVGVGTTFTIRIPVRGPDQSAICAA